MYGPIASALKPLTGFGDNRDISREKVPRKWLGIINGVKGLGQ